MIATLAGGKLVRRSKVVVPVVSGMFMLTLAGCPGTGRETDETPDQPEAQNVLVGRWHQISYCQPRVRALRAVGLRKPEANRAAYFNPLPGVLGPGVDVIDSYNHACRDLTPRADWREFTSTGRLDVPYRDFALGVARYRLVAGGQLILSTWVDMVVDSVPPSARSPSGDFVSIRFHVQWPTDNSIRLQPVLPACARTGCFAAAWAVAVSNPGSLWVRYN
jgi:hypothetical protein